MTKFVKTNAMRQIIYDFLKNDRSFDSGLKLYMQFGNNTAFKAVLNRQGFSDYNHKLLLEELRKLAGITPIEFNAILSEKVIVKKAQQSPPTEEEKVKFLSEIPEEVLKTIKLRDEFPFLNQADCPNELKILVADRISAYHRYVEAHKRLFTATSDEELAQVVKTVVENYIDNNAIWDELKHYKETGELLKKHPIFAAEDRMKEIRAMATSDLVRLKKSLENNIARNKQKIKEQTDHPETAARQNRVEGYQLELSEVNRLLGINA